MKGFSLDAQELSELHDVHCRAKCTGETKLAYRLNAVILLGTGWRLKQVSQALLLNDETLCSYVKRYRESGVAGIASDKHQGRMCCLSSDQEDLLKAHLDERRYALRGQRCYDKHIYKERNFVERFLNRIKQFRRIATRYDKLTVTFMGAISIASILIWLKG